MKTLLVLRHAKSSWKEPQISDHDRPLNKRGNQAAPMMGRFALEQELTPDIILSSSAVRAKRTAELFAEGCNYQGQIHILEAFYLAPPTTFIQIVGQLPDEHGRALVVAHNPGVEELVESLTSEAVTMPTGALACVKLADEHWASLGSETAELHALWLPRELP